MVVVVVVVVVVGAGERSNKAKTKKGKTRRTKHRSNAHNKESGHSSSHGCPLHTTTKRRDTSHSPPPPSAYACACTCTCAYTHTHTHTHAQRTEVVVGATATEPGPPGSAVKVHTRGTGSVEGAGWWQRQRVAKRSCVVPSRHKLLRSLANVSRLAPIGKRAWRESVTHASAIASPHRRRHKNNVKEKKSQTIPTTTACPCVWAQLGGGGASSWCITLWGRNAPRYTSTPRTLMDAPQVPRFL